MTKAIWKFPLLVTDVQQVEMPEHAKILSVQNQDERPCIWAEVNPSGYTEMVPFLIVGTGNPIPPTPGHSREFLATVQTRGGALVWHVFRLVKDAPDYVDVEVEEIKTNQRRLQ